jgi:hypothetical protein
MVEDDLMYSTFGEVYEISCARYGRGSLIFQSSILKSV